MTSKSSRGSKEGFLYPFSSLKSHPSGICRDDPASRFPSLEETRAGDTWGARERDDAELPSTSSFSSPHLVFRRSVSPSRLPSALPSVPYSSLSSSLSIVLLVLGSRKYRLSYSFEGAENRYGAFCARATGEIPNHRALSFLFPRTRPRISPSRRARGSTLVVGV